MVTPPQTACTLIVALILVSCLCYGWSEVHVFDKWGLLAKGECADRRVAYVSICITKEQHVLEQCLTTLCSLLATTDPACVVVLVSLWVYGQARDILVRNGVLPIIAPEWALLPEAHPYAHLQNGSTDNPQWSRLYTFTKLEIARLTQYDKVAYFDADVIFMRNASGLESVSPFAASRIPKGKNTSVFMNSGVMVMQPSQEIYNELVAMWREGDYSLYFSDEENGDQDVFTELCWVRGRCGPASDLDACVFNHGSWIPMDFPRDCPREGAVARHNYRPNREPVLTERLAWAMRGGRCRARSGSDLEQEHCWVGVTEFGDRFTREMCCGSERAPVNIRGGDPRCWFGRMTYERCCIGFDDSKSIREELLLVEDSWYGLSTIPDFPPKDWARGLCHRRYFEQQYTFASVSPAPHQSWKPNRWRETGLPEEVQGLGIKCTGLGRFVLVKFDFWSYFRRHRRAKAVEQAYMQFLSYPFARNALDLLPVCIPKECCFHSAGGTNASEIGLHEVVWHYVTYHMWEAFDRPHLAPKPSPADFRSIHLVNTADYLAEWISVDEGPS